MYGGGGSRRGSYDTEYSDDSNDSRQTTPKSRPFKVQSTPPKKKDLQSKETLKYNLNHIRQCCHPTMIMKIVSFRGRTLYIRLLEICSTFKNRRIQSSLSFLVLASIVYLYYINPDYNLPLIYWWGYCNLSILVYESRVMPGSILCPYILWIYQRGSLFNPFRGQELFGALTLPVNRYKFMVVKCFTLREMKSLYNL